MSLNEIAQKLQTRKIIHGQNVIKGGTSEIVIIEDFDAM